LTNHLSAFRGARHPDAAWRLTYFFTAQEGLRQRVQVQSLMPAHKRTMDEVWLKASPAVRRQVLVDTLPWTRTIWKGRGFLDWNDAVGAALAKAWSGAASVSAAVQEAVDEGTRIIRERAERR
jgi:ABC-type glycerol-3-phosphate transport system substrate-binding protein